MQINLTWHSGTIGAQPSASLRFRYTAPLPRQRCRSLVLCHCHSGSHRARDLFPTGIKEPIKIFIESAVLSIEVFKSRLLIKDLMPKQEPHTENCLWCLPFIWRTPLYIKKIFTFEFTTCSNPITAQLQCITVLLWC